MLSIHNKHNIVYVDTITRNERIQTKISFFNTIVISSQFWEDIDNSMVFTVYNIS